MKRYLLPLLSLFAIGSLSSCFQSETTLRLNKDGSGTLTEETAFGAQAVEMLTQLAAFGGDASKDPLADLVSEEKAKARAAQLGEGVTVEKTEAVNKNGGKGGRTTYHFADINKLKFSGEDAAKGVMPEMPGQPKPEVKKAEPITFKYEGGKLTIHMPEPPKAEKPAGEAPLPQEMGPDEEKQMKQMFADTKVSIKVVIEPGISESNAAHVDGNTITLTEIDFGKVMEKPGAMQKMMTLAKGNPDGAMEEMKKLDGVKVETQREIQVTVK